MSLLTRDIPPRATAAVVVLALAASVVVGHEKPSDPVAVVASIDRSGTIPDKDETRLEVEKLRRELPRPGGADPFAPRSFAPPAPAPAAHAAAAPARPTVPPLPFVYLGKVVDGAKTRVFVARDDENYALEAGQTVAGAYRVEKITDAAVTFTYLPMKARQTLAIPEAGQ